MTVAGPGTRAARELNKAIREGRVQRVRMQPGEDIAGAFIRMTIANVGGYDNLPKGLRPGDIVGPRPKVGKR